MICATKYLSISFANDFVLSYVLYSVQLWEKTRKLHVNDS